MTIGQGIDDGNRGVLGEFGYVRMGVDAGEQDGVESRQDERRVLHALIDAELDVLRTQKECVTAEQVHASFGRHASPGASLLENHGEGVASERFGGCDGIYFGTLAIGLFVIVGEF